MGTIDPVVSKYSKITFMRSKLKKNLAVMIFPQTCKISFQILFNSRNTKITKCGFEHVYFQTSKFVRFFNFRVAHNVNIFVLKICMFVGYIIDYIQLFSDFF
jgi:hypothetical protein